MASRFRSNVLLIFAAVAFAAIGFSAAHSLHLEEVARSHACLGIGQGVCLSGMTEWVAQAAEKSHSQSSLMVAMADDAF